MVLASSDAFGPRSPTTAAAPDKTLSEDVTTGTDVTGRMRIHTPPGSRIRDTTGRHRACGTLGQDSAHSQPPLPATASAGLGSRCATQVAPWLPVSSRRSAAALNIQTSAPETATTW